ncbi:MAG: hypothetical protein B7Y80_08225 [Hyphomicrobium sp. 32-62-53]|nr:MAG: hypothetical protein B7Z29_16175 [Hyphomicrobium sp. 12-62-95]OYY00123.1 MAG: hypothetical protein B7Y80_08225 [Hyphomicrobium sp. 32-62-53]
MGRIRDMASLWRTKTSSQAPTAASRDRIARRLALLATVGLILIFVSASGMQFLMPGPLTSAHSSIEACSSCHARSGNGKLSWLAGLAPGDPHGDSKACLTCHKMSDTAFAPHGAAQEVLEQSTARLVKMAAETSQPLGAQAQAAAFPTHTMVAEGLECATCHQEHQGATFNLKAMSNEQCRSCHAVKFDSFDGAHPDFEGYPFKRRTRIVFDHAGHFGKHYPELAKKEPGKPLPATCSTCHDSTANRRIMSIAPFDKTCSTCHLDQITGKERASGPKGIAFLSFPGLDLATLRKKGAQIGEWPEDSEASLTPFMKVIIARNERGAALVKSLNSISLQDLSAATDGEIKAVTALVWEIKTLFHAMISGKASDILANLTIGGGPKLTAAAISDLTANLPRDVIASAQQQWLPNLAKEIAARPDTGARQRSGWNQGAVRHKSAVLALMQSQANISTLKPLRMAQAESAETSMPRRPLPSGTPRSIELGDQDAGTPAPSPAKAKPQPTSDANPSEGTSTPTNATEAATSPAQPPSDPANRTDELLAPTEAELRDIKAREKGASPQKSAAPATAQNPAVPSDKPGSAPPTETATTTPIATPVANAATSPDNSISSDIDPETRADTGGWYRQDHAILYRPAGHKDKFIASWLLLTGPVSSKGAPSPEAAVFDTLTAKDAQGSCAKCHSIDETTGKGRTVNFTPITAKAKTGQFTRFFHEPHFGLMDERGCVSCHELKKGQPTLKSYEQGDPKVLASNFGPVKKQVCKTCHTASAARQDCTLCHAYHVNGVSTPIMKTKIPTP